MTVMLYGLADIRMELSLLEMGVQLMILPTTTFCTMNATSYRFQIFSAVPHLVSLFVVVSPKPVHLTSAKLQDVQSIAFLTHG